MRVAISWTRYFAIETEAEVEVPDDATAAQAKAFVREKLEDGTVPAPMAAGATWDGSGFAEFVQVDDEGTKQLAESADRSTNSRNAR